MTLKETGLFIGLLFVVVIAVAGLSVAAKQTDAAHEAVRQEQKDSAERIAFLEGVLEKVFGHVPDNTFSLPVTVTAYTASVDETNGEPWVTADMTPSRIGLLAVSRDLLDEVGLKMGQVVILEGLGVFKVRDKLNKRYARRVDILMAHKKAAKLFGKRTATLTWVN